MLYKKNSCVYMSFNIERHIYTSIISLCFSPEIMSLKRTSFSIHRTHSHSYPTPDSRVMSLRVARVPTRDNVPEKTSFKNHRTHTHM